MSSTTSDTSLLASLTSMGFPEAAARRSIAAHRHVAAHERLQHCVEWLMSPATSRASAAAAEEETLEDKMRPYTTMGFDERDVRAVLTGRMRQPRRGGRNHRRFGGFFRNRSNRNGNDGAVPTDPSQIVAAIEREAQLREKEERETAEKRRRQEEQERSRIRSERAKERKQKRIDLLRRVLLADNALHARLNGGAGASASFSSSSSSSGSRGLLGWFSNGGANVNDESKTDETDSDVVDLASEDEDVQSRMQAKALLEELFALVVEEDSKDDTDEQKQQASAKSASIKRANQTSSKEQLDACQVCGERFIVPMSEYVVVNDGGAAEEQEAHDDRDGVDAAAVMTAAAAVAAAAAASDVHDDRVAAVSMTTCGHRMICDGCFQRYVRLRVDEEDVLPWIPCPAAECTAYVSPADLTRHGVLSTTQLLHLSRVVLRKTMSRSHDWVSCKTKGCDFGFVLTSHSFRSSCAVCRKAQTVERPKVELDDGMKELLRSGVMRGCPKCGLPQMKDKGMCNIMHCSGAGQGARSGSAGCGVFWNWRTKETGKTYRQLKNRARMNGTLWEAGELQYQLQLQRSNPEEFKALLERNGIEYDPNYRRGSS